MSIKQTWALRGSPFSHFRPEDLLALRKLKRSQKGIDIQKLNKGEGKKRKRAKAEDDLRDGSDVKDTSHADDDEHVI